MVKSAVLLAAFATVISAQDDVQVDCTPDHMEIRVTKGKGSIPKCKLILYFSCG